MNITELRTGFPGAWLAGLTSVVVASLVACGGGGNATTGTDASASSTQQTYSGTVSGLGSIVVNGVRFTTTDATTADADDPTQPYTQAFKLGTTVVVKGSVSGSDGQAASIELVGGVRGKVSAADTTTGTLTVAGQSVVVDSNTVFDGEGDVNFTLTSIAAAVNASTAVYVEVYGTADANNVILATRIEKKDPTALVFALKGYVVAGSINTTTHHFNMLLKRGNTVTTTVDVDYGTATVLPHGATLSDGLGVRVLTDTDPAGLTNITAKKVLIKSNRQANGSAAKLHGVVSSISGTTWAIGDVTIDVSQSPILRGFNSLSDVTVGTKLRVAGLFKDSVLTAKIIESDDFEHDRDGGGVKLFGVASGVDSVARTFSVQGVTVKVPNLPAFSLPTEGSYVEVIATQINGVLTAVHISGSNSPKPFEVFGTASCTNGVSDLKTTFSLTLPLGSVAVDGSNATIEAERGVNLTASDSAKTCLLEVKGTLSSVNGVKTLAATKIEVLARR